MKKKIILMLVMACILGCQVSCTDVDYDPFATIKGTVVDDSTEEPIDVAIVILSTPPQSKKTNIDGKYEFSKIDPGNNTIRVSKDGYETYSMSVELIGGETEIVNFRLKKE